MIEGGDLVWEFKADLASPTPWYVTVDPSPLWRQSAHGTTAGRQSHLWRVLKRSWQSEGRWISFRLVLLSQKSRKNSKVQIYVDPSLAPLDVKWDQSVALLVYRTGKDICYFFLNSTRSSVRAIINVCVKWPAKVTQTAAVPRRSVGPACSANPPACLGYVTDINGKRTFRGGGVSFAHDRDISHGREAEEELFWQTRGSFR